MKHKADREGRRARGDAPASSTPKWRAPLFAAALALCAYRAVEYHNYWNSLSPVVEVAQGPLQGRAARTDAGTEYFAFQGIPFAAPPVGPLRFRDPQPPASWAPEVRDARADGPICSQVAMPFPSALPSNVSVIDVVRFLGKIPALVHRVAKALRQSEDCLHLNVYTPKVGAAASLPVFVFIHGGAFVFGDNGLDVLGPQHIVERDVILVTVNYRLGALGFLAVGEAANGSLAKAPEGVGNAALKDVVAALRWVRDNIAQFGGDPGRVTLGGQSAGGALASYMTVVPAARGLFHRLVAMSGSMLHHLAFSTPEQALARTRTLVRNLVRPEVAGGPDAPAAPDVADPADVLRYLREVDVHLLLDKDTFADMEEVRRRLSPAPPVARAALT
ncbi:hypothetical protein ONE63_001942 [Megalurothrips usitatus]|uniref:Carboxylic ester hydrolase n=1 Tax=Megalurothrips usitatus TaxID=439358 RepID=A0AAV7X9V6_9NEOP|nr:hypothetical protein ONE63_001942 [Megalurothrips usitatus]